MKTNSIIMIILFGSASISWAVPTLYPDRIVANIKNYTNSNLLSDSENPNRIYVLPPNSSYVKVSSFNSVTSNVGFCQEISEIQKFNLDTIKLINSLKTKELELKTNSESIDVKLNQAKSELAQFVVTNNLQELMSLDGRIQSLEQRLLNLYTQLNTCKNSCASIQQDIEDSLNMRRDLMDRRYQLSSSNIYMATEYQKRKNFIEEADKDKQLSVENLRKIRINLFELYHDYLDLYDAHSKREGGRISLNYESNWQKNVERLMFDNPNLSFEKAPTKNAFIKADAYSKENLSPMGSIIGFNISGVATLNSVKFNSFPESFSGDATINLLSSCPILHPDWFGIDPHSDLANPLNMKYALTVTYDYPSEFKYEVKVNYNLVKMYDLVKSQGRSGGFLNTRSWSEVDEKQFFKDTFSTEWISNNDQINLTEEKKMHIESDMRNQILTRLSGYLLFTGAKSSALTILETPNLSQNGALVLSQSLNDTCGVALYCRVASLGLNLISAIFSSSEIKQEMRQNLNVDSSQIYKNKQVVLQNSVSVFR